GAALAGEAVGMPLDPLTPLRHVRSLPPGPRLGGPELAARLRLEGAALAAAQLLGIAEATQELAVAYAKQREQFGRTIGGFQSIKHMLADMFVRQEMARAAVYAARATLDDPGREAPGPPNPHAGREAPGPPNHHAGREAPGPPNLQTAVGDVARAVASAKVVAGEAAMRNARACIQVHGGMGYTWEMPPHYYLKR